MTASHYECVSDYGHEHTGTVDPETDLCEACGSAILRGRIEDGHHDATLAVIAGHARRMTLMGVAPVKSGSAPTPTRPPIVSAVYSYVDAGRASSLARVKAGAWSR